MPNDILSTLSSKHKPFIEILNVTMSFKLKAVLVKNYYIFLARVSIKKKSINKRRV